MDIDKKIAEIETRWEILKSNYDAHGIVEVSGGQIAEDEEWLINQLKAHRKVLDDKEDHLLEVYDQLKECKEECKTWKEATQAWEKEAGITHEQS